MLFHCILANERPSGSNLQLMLVLDPQVKSLNKAMTTSVCFSCLQYWSHPEEPSIFPDFCQMSSLFKKQKGLYTL